MAKEVGININIKGTKDVIDLQKQIRQVNRQLKETEDVEAFDKLAADLVKLKAQLREARKEQRQAVDAFAATDKGIGAYSRLSAQLRVARNNLKDLQASGTATGAEIEKLTKEINELDTTLKDIDRSVGQTNREVGNYEEAVRKAIGVTDAQTGAYSRLEARLKIVKKAYNDVAVTEGKASKQAKELRQEITKLEKQLDKTGKSAQAGGKRIGGLRTQLRGLGPGVAGVASSFLIFSELPAALDDAIQGFRSFAAFVSSAEASNRRFGESIKEGALQLVEQKSELDRSFTAIENTTFGTKEYDDAVKDLTASYGPYLDDIARQELALGNVEAAQRRATQALIDEIAAQQTRIQATKIIEDFATAQAEALEIQANAATTSGKIIDDASAGLLKSSPLGIFAQQAFGLGESYSEISTQINEETQKNLIQQSKDLGKLEENLKEGLTEINAALEAANFDLSATSDEAAKEREAEALKRQQAATKKRADQLARDRERILQQEERTAQAQIQLIERLEEQIIKAQLDAQEEGLTKALQQEEQATNKRIENLESQQAKFVQEAQQRQAKINAAFGEGSEQALRLQGEIAAQRIAITENTDTAIEAEREASLQRIADIRKTFADKEAQEAQQQLQKRLSELQKERSEVAGAVNQELLQIREARAKGNIDAIQADKQAFEARKANILEQIELLESQEEAVITLGLEIESEEFQGIVNQRQQLNTQLAELEEAQTNKVRQEAQTQAQIRQQAFEQVAENFLNTVNIISGIGELVSDANRRQLEEEAEQQQQQIANLEAQLSEASGLERAFLEQRIERETKAAQEIAAQQARAEKEAAVAKKAVSITEAVINTALAITNALASLPPPASFVTAAITGALGAVQIATIAAQPLATGGIVGFDGGGKVNQSQNIPTQSNGDNVLATLKRGEVVLNQRQQSLLGGSQTFRNIGVPGFQGGGVVSPPIGAPSLAQSVSDSNNVQQLIETNSRLIASVNSRIDRISVEYTTETGDAIERDNRDRKQITTRATL